MQSKKVVHIFDRRDGDAYRLLQAEALLELFRRDKGRDCSSVSELEEWVVARRASDPLPKPIDPFAVLGFDVVGPLP